MKIFIDYIAMFIDGIRHVVASTYGCKFKFRFEETEGRSTQEVDVYVRKCQTSDGNDSREET